MQCFQDGEKHKRNWYYRLPVCLTICSVFKTPKCTRFYDIHSTKKDASRNKFTISNPVRNKFRARTGYQRTLEQIIRTHRQTDSNNIHYPLLSPSGVCFVLTNRNRCTSSKVNQSETTTENTRITFGSSIMLPLVFCLAAMNSFSSVRQPPPFCPAAMF